MDDLICHLINRITNNRRLYMVLFELGQIVATRGAIEELSQDDINTALSFYVKGNWGILEAEDCEANEEAIREGYRILGKYRSVNGVEFYIITEADRSYTTVLLPSEY
jgi:hypothetical protein